MDLKTIFVGAFIIIVIGAVLVLISSPVDSGFDSALNEMQGIWSSAGMDIATVSAADSSFAESVTVSELQSVKSKLKEKAKSYSESSAASELAIVYVSYADFLIQKNIVDSAAQEIQAFLVDEPTTDQICGKLPELESKLTKAENLAILSEEMSNKIESFASLYPIENEKAGIDKDIPDTGLITSRYSESQGILDSISAFCSGEITVPEEPDEEELPEDAQVNDENLNTELEV